MKVTSDVVRKERTSSFRITSVKDTTQREVFEKKDVGLTATKSMKVIKTNQTLLTTCDDSSDPQEGYQRTNAEKEIYMMEVGAAVNKLVWHDGTSITSTDKETTNNQMSNVTRSRNDIEKETLEKDEDRSMYEGNDNKECESFENNLQEKVIRSPIYRGVEQADEIPDHDTGKDDKNDQQSDDVGGRKSNNDARGAENINYNQFGNKDEP